MDSNTGGAGEPENRPASRQLLGHWCLNRHLIIFFLFRSAQDAAPAWHNAVHILPPTLRERGSVFVQLQSGWSAARNAGNRHSFWQYYRPKKTEEFLGNRWTLRMTSVLPGCNLAVLSCHSVTNNGTLWNYNWQGRPRWGVHFHKLWLYWGLPVQVGWQRNSAYWHFILVLFNKTSSWQQCNAMSSV